MKTKTKTKASTKNNAIHNLHTAITISEGVEKYLQDITIRHYSDKTIYGYRLRLKVFLRWTDERALSLASSITEAHIDRYRRYLHQYTYAGKRIAAATQKGHLLVIKQVFGWLTKNR